MCASIPQPEPVRRGPTRRSCSFVGARRAGIVSGLAVLFVAATAIAGPIWIGKVESARNYAQIATHGPLMGPNDTHNLAPQPAQFWASPVSLIGTWGPPDTITAIHRADHLVAVCPGEAAPAPWWLPPPISPPPVPWGRSWAGQAGRVRHPGPPNHLDYYVEILGAQYGGAVPQRLTRYLFASSGVHDPELCAGRAGLLEMEQVVPPPPPPLPPPEYAPIGVMALSFDGGTNTFALSIGVQGIPQPQLLGASLNLGAPGVSGPPIMDLGPPSEWVPLNLEQPGIARIITDATLPPGLGPELLAGHMYVQLYTVEYPQGQLRGQLLEVPELPFYPVGDTDCDGRVRFSDIDYFVAALPDNEPAWRALYQARHGGAEPACPFMNADCNGDGHVNFADIDPFVALIGT